MSGSRFQNVDGAVSKEPSGQGFSGSASTSGPFPLVASLESAMDAPLSPRELPFLAEERADVTILFGGLTWKHERLIEGLLAGAGYRCQALPETDRAAHELGKEFCASGLCNPVYFTAGNLIRFLRQLEAIRAQSRRDRQTLCLFHSSMRRPVPLQYVRGGIPYGATGRRIRRIPHPLLFSGSRY